MKFSVRIFTETTYRGPARTAGAAMWLVEYIRAGEPITRQGVIHLEDGTENRAELVAITDALGILTKSCSVRVITGCDTILNTMKNGWPQRWQQEGWINAKGRPVKNADLWAQLLEEMEKHEEITFERGPHEYTSIMQMVLRKEIEKCRSTKN